MNKSIIAISVILLLFLLNVTLYSQSENYRFFIKKIKNRDQIVYSDKPVVDDSPAQLVTSAIDTIQQTPEERDILATSALISSKNNVDIANSNLDPIEPTIQIVLGKNYQELLNKFSQYNLWKLELRSSLFDVTDEYPDEYYEYYSKDLILYLFPTKTYEDILDIFAVQPELPVEINKVNNFGDNSFYINLIPADKKHVRVVINHKSSVFWLKIKKDEYNEIKNILNNL